MDIKKIEEILLNEIQKTEGEATPKTTYEVHASIYNLLSKIETYNNEVKFYNSLKKRRFKNK